ncbi:hypothetical protein KNE206_53280 [Kitasatospora sp. NE20-6]|uniref:hypothetical protein n=1 Tax=Kitasatospora sp. NE20-6 TaxID=2859066 RepID=UPI0034DB7FA2
MSTPTVGSARIGTTMVLRALGVERLFDVPGWRDDEGTPLGHLAGQLHHAARRLDHVQETLVGLAAGLQRDLQRLADGQDVDLPQTGVALGHTAQQLDLLVARRTELHQHLEHLTALHKTITAATTAPDPAQPGPDPALRAAPGQDAARTDKLSGPQRQALDAVARGLVSFRDSGARGNRTVIIAPGLRLHGASVNSLIERKLVERDTSTSLYRGQKLRLTLVGARVHATLTGTPRTPAAPAVAAAAVSAALQGALSIQTTTRAVR